MDDVSIPLPYRPKPQRKKPTPADVIRSELQKAYDLHPAYLMPGAVIGALEEAGFTIISTDDLDREIAYAYQAGTDDAAEE